MLDMTGFADKQTSFFDEKVTKRYTIQRNE